jgi:hypothetical protein
MKKLFCVIAGMLPLISSAGAYETNANILGIVTPDIATGVATYSSFASDENGNMVVCLPDEIFGRGTCKQWRSIQSQVPNGKKYVGFSIVMSSSTNKQLYIWWK